MKTNVFLILFFGVSFYGFSQNAGSQTNEPASVTETVQPDATTLEIEEAMQKAVAKWYLEAYGIKDFFKKYPDYPPYVNTGDQNHGQNDYKERVLKWIDDHPDFKNMVKDDPGYKELAGSEGGAIQKE